VANSDKDYASIVGIAQKFPDREVVEVRDTSAGDVYDFKIRSANTQGVVSVSAFASDYPEGVNVEQGDLIGVDGAYTTNEKNGVTYVNITAKSLVIVKPVERAATERAVANKKGSGRKASEPKF